MTNANATTPKASRSMDSSEFRRGSDTSSGSFSAGVGMVMLLMGGYFALLVDGVVVGLSTSPDAG